MPTLYHCISARSFRVLWMLEELHLPYDLRMLAFPPRAHDKSFLELNPRGTVPLFIDGETHMTESAAICEYLALRHSPGVLNSTDTFFIDDIQLLPQGPCAGSTPDPDIIDDYDCNRNAVYDNGWDSLHVVKNPAPSPDNNSRKVGEFRRPSGPGTEYAAFVVDYEKPIDLSTRYIFGLKLWAPKAGNLLLKIEGG